MKNQNSSFTDTKFRNSNNRSVHNQNQNHSENVIKNSKQVNIAHMDARVLVYVWLISFLSTLFLAVCGYMVLDNKIQEQSNQFNSFVTGLIKNPDSVLK